jgi:hypothetical protein
MIIFTLELTGDSEGLDLTDLSSANSFTGSTYGTPISPSSNVIIVQYPSVELTNKNCPSGDL